MSKKTSKEMLILVRDVVLTIIAIGIVVGSIIILANPDIVGWFVGGLVYLMWAIATPIIWILCTIWNRGDD